jgi:hypothetical protein
MRPSLVLAVFTFSCSLGLVSSGQVPARAQQASELRVQLDALQRQLEALSQQEAQATSNKVTEIGSAAARQREVEQPRMVVRIYDLSDLFAIAPPYAAREPGDLEETPRAIFPEVTQARSGTSGGGMGGMGGMGGGFFAVPTVSKRFKDKSRDTLAQGAGEGSSEIDASRTTIDDLIDTITTSISPEDWVDVGGPASIKALGASLVISAPAEMHEQIAALLDLFRTRWGSLRTVSIQAHWLWLTEAQLTDAVADPQPIAKGQPAAFGALSDAGWKRLREMAQGQEQKRPGYHAVLTCYNGQTVNVQAGRQRLLVSGMTPVVGGQESAAAYSPSVRAIHEGAALQITPVVTRTAKYVVADVHSRVNLPAATDKPQAAAGETVKPASTVEQVVAAIDRDPVESQRISTTLRIPVGRPTLVGGMTFHTKAAEEPNLYLFVTAIVQELRDEEGAEVKANP